MIYYDLNLKGSTYQNDYNLIKQANQLGWNYLNLLYSPDDYFNALDYKDKLVEDSYDISQNTTEIGMGIYIYDSNPNEIRKITNKFRNKADFISVFGGKNEINRVVLENRHIDVLSRPYYRRNDCGINHVLSKEALKNQVAIELSFRDVLTNFLSYRSKVLSHFRDIIQLQRKFKFPLIISTSSEDVFDIRSPRDIASFFRQLGLSDDELENVFYTTPKSIVDFNEHRREYIFEGVKIVKKEDKVD
ncbi:ribonuclease P protein component 3 [uncultured Methanobrevibacter sp.]|uniref:ribonuclease P protein component 3 n=1 Tax=uncultured Methanobrevibacter sp. TaxID=253161 RepID=UPI0025F88ED4|nr:RNase P subunit p30 family protein [uncultured Methanobrevibacter sp.]